MLKVFISLVFCLVAVLQSADPTAAALRKGELLRLHVIAQDDTDAMQRVKYPVRNAVQAVYAAQADPMLDMLQNAAALLPAITQAARSAAQEAGFTGSVEVSLGRAAFDTRTLQGHVIPAGMYPALIIRLGDAQGHNWWGLLDPQRSLEAARCGDDASLCWDWSPGALWQALMQGFSLWWGSAV